MDFIRMNCPIAVLTEETKTSDVSKLPSAAFISFSHPSGLILMKSKIAPQENKKNTFVPSIYGQNTVRTNILKNFSVERFSRGLNEGHGVVLGGLELADGSLLMADRYKTGSRGAIRRIHSISSIFHLL